MAEAKQTTFIRDLILTQATAALTVAGLIVVTRLLAKGLGAELFGVYALGRRVTMMAIPLATVSAGVSITRYVAQAEDEWSRLRFLVAGLILAVLPCALIAVVAAGLAPQVSAIVFGAAQYAPVCRAWAVMLVGYALYTVSFSLYRGSGRIGTANLWQLGVVVLCPIVASAVLARRGEVAPIVFVMGAAYYAVLLPLGANMLRGFRSSREGLRVGSALAPLVRYGAPRIPGSFALYGLFVIGPLLAPHFLSLKESGYLVVGQSLLVIVEGGLSAFTVVLLPKVSRLVAEKRDEFIRERVGNLLAFVFHCGLFAMLHLALWSDQIVWGWVGSEYAPAVPVVRIFAVVTLPYATFMMCRPVIDAVEEKAVNTLNLLVSLVLAAVLCFVLSVAGAGLWGLAAGAAAGFWALGLKTFWYVRRRFRTGTGQFRIVWVLLLNAGCIAAGWAVKSGLEEQDSAWLLVCGAVVFECVLAGAYFLALRRLKVEWISELEKRLFPLRQSEQENSSQ
ncbi:MAG: lipopolysaccharide biosynthesis protein [Planctomycetota bacterium]